MLSAEIRRGALSVNVIQASQEMELTVKVPYSGKLSWEKTFANFVDFDSFAKLFSANILFFSDSRKFSPSKVSRYTVLHEHKV